MTTGANNTEISAFFSNKYKMNDIQNQVMIKKDNLECEYYHLRGHKKESCYKLVGYPPSHKFYKNKKENLVNMKNPKENIVNLSVLDSASSSHAPSSHASFIATNSAQIFSQEQYQQILVVFSKDTNGESMANFPGSFIILLSSYLNQKRNTDTGANNYITSNVSCTNSPISCAFNTSLNYQMEILFQSLKKEQLQSQKVATK